MKEILLYSKETDNKFRWDANIDGTIFKFYIPKWRIPKPVPQKIKVMLFYPPNIPNVNHLTCELALNDLGLRKLPIIAEVSHSSILTETVRFDPTEQNEPEIGSPYIPISLLPDIRIKKVVICVQWS